ncbi:MAG: hypothetical protein J5I81_04270 [Nitrococcus mobilis]|nr:hypothetical protein [Nitrococcus mobilis]
MKSLVRQPKRYALLVCAAAASLFGSGNASAIVVSPTLDATTLVNALLSGGGPGSIRVA